MQVITINTTQHYSNLWNSLIFICATYADLFKVLLFSQEFEQLVKTNYMLGNPCQLCYYKLIAWLFGRLVIKCSLPSGGLWNSTKLPRVTGITNLPQAMLLLIINETHTKPCTGPIDYSRIPISRYKLLLRVLPVLNLFR